MKMEISTSGSALELRKVVQHSADMHQWQKRRRKCTLPDNVECEILHRYIGGGGKLETLARWESMTDSGSELSDDKFCFRNG